MYIWWAKQLEESWCKGIRSDRESFFWIRIGRIRRTELLCCYKAAMNSLLVLGQRVRKEECSCRCCTRDTGRNRFENKNMKKLFLYESISVEQLRNGYSRTSTIPLGRSGKLQEVADLVCYYLSERSSYITGVTTNISGGKQEDKG